MDIAAGEKKAADQKAEQQTEQQTLMQSFQRMFDAEPAPSITLTNIYKEIPISNPATLSEVKRDQIELRTTELQLAAICQCKEVYIKAPHFRGPVVGRLESIDIRRNAVKLSNLCYAVLDEEKRTTLRVRFKKPLSILMHAGPDKISGVIHDISLGGCCLNTLVRIHSPGSGDVNVELKLIDHKSNQLCAMRIPSSIVRIEGDAPPFRCALRFEHSVHSEQFLSVFINQRQLEILKELRETV
jgi:hypothetical protein